MRVQPILRPLPGERLAGILPELRPTTDAGWQRRLNFFAGRALTPAALAAEQDSRAARLALRGQCVSPGIIHGLRVGLEHVPDPADPTRFLGWRFHVEPGLGLTVSGEDVSLPRALAVDAPNLRIVGPHASLFPAPEGATESVDVGTRRFEPRLAELSASTAPIPRAGMLLLQPIETEETGRFHPDEACEIDPERLAFEDERRVDGCRLVYFPWPDYSEWPASQPQIPPASTWLTLPAEGPQWRNRLAYAIFEAERRQSTGARIIPRARASASGETSWILPYEPFAWCDFGVPLALVAWDPEGTPIFVDRAAVARAGGRSPGRTPLVPESVSSFLAQARMEQFLAEMAEELDSGSSPDSSGSLSAVFRFLPPAGLLPIQAIELLDQTAAERRFDGDRVGRSLFFPSIYNVETVPVPLEQLELALDASACLAPYDLSAGDEVRILVPVPQSVFDPNLLTLERPQPEFTQALRRFERTREVLLLSRESLRSRVRTLARSLEGRTPDFPSPEKDPGRLEEEPLPTPGSLPFPTARQSPHRPFELQNATFASRFEWAPGQADLLKLWVHPDLHHPPEAVAIEFNPFEPNGPIAVWGTLLPEFARRPGVLPLGPLPQGGRWTALDLRLSTLTDLPPVLTQARIWIARGRVALGPFQTHQPDTTLDATWIEPSAPEALPDTAWEAVDEADLLAPFETSYGTAILRTVPFASTTAHLSVLRAGWHLHDFSGASQTLTPATNDVLYAYVHLDPTAPPLEIGLDFHVAGNWVNGATWGRRRLLRAAPNQPSESGRLSKGALPSPGRWIRLELTAAETSLGNRPIDGIAFRVFGGRAAWGPVGTIAVDTAVERPWFDGTGLPAGASANTTTAPEALEPWTFITGVDAAAPFAANPSLIERGLRVATALGDLENTLTTRSPWLRPLVDRLPLIGLDAFIEQLKRAADQADDAVDFGFVQAQTNIYRLRQLVLGNEVASKLAVSPVLSALVKGETAVATKADIKTFLEQLKARSTPPPAPPADGGGAGPAPASPAPVERLSASAFSNPGLSNALGSAALMQPSLSPAATASLVRFPTRAALFDVTGIAGRAELTQAGSQAATSLGSATATPLAGQLLKTTAVTSADLFRTDLDLIRTASPVFTQKVDVRTATVAQRLAPPSAEESKSFAAAARAELLQTLVGLQLHLDDLFVPSLFFDNKPPLREDGTPDTTATIRTRRVTFGELKASDRDFIQEVLDGKQDFVEDTATAGTLDEARQFSAGSRATEATVATLRVVEARIREYRLAHADCERVRTELAGQWTLAQERLGAVDRDLIEARHDVAVGRALYQDELDRVQTINHRRDAVLREHVRFLAFIRPRTTVALETQVPTRILEPAYLDAPLPTFLRVSDEVAPELRAFLELFRHAPLRWFPSLVPLLNQLKDPESLQALLRLAESRSSRLLGSDLALPARTETRFQAAIQSAFLQSARFVVDARKKSLEIQFGALSQATWKQLHAEALRLVSVGDLLEVPHGNGDLPGRTSQHLDWIGRVASGLHAEFGAVPPAIRLVWAEQLSQFDQAVTLRDLGRLPRFEELLTLDRRQMQACADWLFSRVDPTEPEAIQLINDLVRICLLLASHAPVNQIIAGRVPKPMPAIRGNLLPLATLDPSKVRRGMTVLLHQNATVVAKAVVEDLASTEVTARVTETVAATVQLDTNTRVQFVAATSFTAPITLGEALSPKATAKGTAAGKKSKAR